MTNKDKIEKSIICTKYECYICRRVENLQLHHCISGSGNRALADKDGLFVMLCPYDHSLLHDQGFYPELKAVAQRAFVDQKIEEGYSESQARGLWLNRYGRFYD